MEREKIAEVIRSGKAVLGMEFGSTRIKAVLVDPREQCQLHPAAMTGKTVLKIRSGPTVWKISGKDLQDCYAGSGTGCTGKIRRRH